ncbi:MULTISPECIES: HAD family hydrolase [Thalassolituus]|uniref:histidinol-phosphatase n=1 Tax=Thalassolituus TaxID=187492 RepID=UPI00042DB68B|nr:HAD family hydrolase [Thalassolituus oleivorans]AHK17050.1 phosphoserine phosphatase [Thalassolituus oleivorans R6-15]MBQ0728529.1 HAD family hydrolase [Thalassolituus oleivorans]MBQ0780109.1 HAD family hydrolase [Thalassolituus oleivorans]MCA6126871.1 phosphoserine phosphatase [Thalassolituus oleivorans 4BN06-13]
MALAIFDLDHTLLSGDSDHAWGQYLVDRGLVDPAIHQQRNDHFYEQYKSGSLDIHEYLEFAMRPLTQYDTEQMLAERERFLIERIDPLITQHARDLIEKHRAAGDVLLIITATNGFVTYPIAERLDIEHIIAPHPEVVDGRYTGKTVGIPSFQGGKVTRLNDWIAEHQHSLEGSYFYSDSHNDLPLLRIVDHPVAVDPDDTLKAAAEAAGWPIISLRVAE